MPKFNLNHPIPFLFLGDACDSLTGLGRIGHDLAWLISSMPEFKLGYLGRGGFGRSRFPWTSYNFSEQEQWGEGRIEQAWNDLAGNQKGIIFTCWDASRLLWFVDGRDPFLQSDRFERWGYFMADGTGVIASQLPQEQAHVISRYQRALMASKWAYRLAEARDPVTGEGPSIRVMDMDWMPHPINREIFKPLPRLYGRSAWAVPEQDTLIGCVMTNQARKQWPVVMEAMAHLGGMTKTRPRLWLHTDLLLNYWNLQALAVEYGIGDQIICENRPLSDSELAMRYSACDATVIISGGEGFCYPIAESLSCGVPAITGSYGAQAELTKWHVEPVTTIIDTSHNVRRAIYDARDVADALLPVLLERPSRECCESLVSHLNMKEIGVQWKRWFRKGL